MMGGYLEGYILTEKIFVMRGVYIYAYTGNRRVKK
jgi:hypothetical protein